MAQADRIIMAIRQLLSRGRPSKSTSLVQAYLTVVVSDAAQKIPGGALNRSCLDHVFQDLSADAPCAIRHAAEEMREHENWRAS